MSGRTVGRLLHDQRLNITAVILQGKAGENGKPGAPGKMVTSKYDSFSLHTYLY